MPKAARALYESLVKLSAHELFLWIPGLGLLMLRLEETTVAVGHVLEATWRGLASALFVSSEPPAVVSFSAGEMTLLHCLPRAWCGIADVLARKVRQTQTTNG